MKTKMFIRSNPHLPVKNLREDPDYIIILNTTSKRLPLLWFVDNIDAVYDEFQKEVLRLIMY